jgi:hypothetical protein
VIGRLRRALSSAFGRSEAGRPAQRRQGDTEAGRRIEAARERLKQAIPPRED